VADLSSEQRVGWCHHAECHGACASPPPAGKEGREGGRERKMGKCAGRKIISKGGREGGREEGEGHANVP